MVFLRLCQAIFQDVFSLLATIGIVLLMTLIVIWKTRPKPGRNPFSLDHLQPPRALVTDHAKRNAVIKQRFRASKIPSGLDAVVVGSGIGGLSAALLMARAGKKVLVLEQHDQAGGCCHTFTDKGYEFDTGIHYVGKMQEGTETRILVDFLTNGQLVWEPLDDAYDTVAIGPPGEARRYPHRAGRVPWVANMKAMFPDDGAAIDKFMNILDENRGAILGLILPKLYPRWLVKILIMTGYIRRMFPTFYKYARLSLGQALDTITDNAELKAVLAYAYGDLGPSPTTFSLPIYCSLMNHYIPGAHYPRGGSSEVAFHMIPSIQALGGEVLVNAPVTKILVGESGQAYGVRVTKNNRQTDIMAEMVISDAGVANTFHRLLPGYMTRGSALYDVVTDVGPSSACLTLFVGLQGTKQQLELPAGNTWAFLSPDLDGDLARYMALDEDAASCTFSPMLFVGFPSAKDPSWESRYPGKSTCSVIALCPHRWFRAWADQPVKHRGPEYETLKKAFGQLFWHQVERLFPLIEGKLEYLDVGTPLSNGHYLGSRTGEIYGLDHSVARVTPTNVMELRPQTDVPGLYLTGQDVFTGGFAGALYGGLMCASAVLHRNLMVDLKAYSRLARNAGTAKPGTDADKQL